MTLLLDTHVLYWWSVDSTRLSAPARRALRSADEIAASDITWFELAWMAAAGRVRTTLPVRAWLARLSPSVRTISITPAIAAAAASLPASFPRDPADRLIYATALEHDIALVTRDREMHRHGEGRLARVIW